MFLTSDDDFTTSSIGLEVKTIDGTAKIKSIEQAPPAELFDLDIAAANNFCANGIFVHNIDPGLIVEANATSETFYLYNSAGALVWRAVFSKQSG